MRKSSRLWGRVRYNRIRADQRCIRYASLILEKRLPGLDEVLRISGGIPVPDLVVDVRSRAPPSRSEGSDRRAPLHLCAGLDQDRAQMSVARAHTVTVIDLDRVAVSAPPAGIGDDS